MTRKSGPGRTPSREMSAEDLVGLVDALEERGVSAWLDGGWAVDAALGQQTRTHDDLDLVVELRDAELVQATLEGRGFTVALGGAPKSIELVDSDGRQVDVHPVRLTPNGDGLYRMESGDDWTYPAAGFAGDGVVLGRRVRCLTPEVQMLCHTGYEPYRSSYDDVRALSRRFGIAVPEEYRHAEESYRPREA